MDYFLHYRQLVEKPRSFESWEFFELHHILPRCMGGGDDSKNIVKLSPREHQLAHLLLCKMHPKNSQLIFAANMMFSASKHLNRNGKSPLALREGVSRARREAWAHEPTRAAYCEAMRKAWENESRRKDNSLRMKTYWSNPATRKANSVKLKSHWSARPLLSNDEVSRASELYLQGLTWTQLAEKFNVKRTTIRRYVFKHQLLTVTS